jgi:hypothetical protein
VGVLVAVGAQIFPVAAVRRIVVVVAVSVVNGQEVPVGMIKFPAAPCADEAVNRERTFPVVFPRWLLHALFHLPNGIADGFLRFRSVTPDARSDTSRPAVKRNLCHFL